MNKPNRGMATTGGRRRTGRSGTRTNYSKGGRYRDDDDE